MAKNLEIAKGGFDAASPMCTTRIFVEEAPEELSKQIPEVDKFFGTTNQNEIIKYLFGKEHISDDPNYYRSLLTPNHYAYLKIAEGCDNGCSFCSIPLMRGLQKSRSIDSILWEVEKLLFINGECPFRI